MAYAAIVVGAGVVGLSSALNLQKKGFNVTIVSEKFNGNTTSHVAGGIFLPYNRNVLGAEKRELAVYVVKRSYKHYQTLEKSHSTYTGVSKTFGYQCYFVNHYGEKLPDEPLAWEVVDKLRTLSDEELKSFSPNHSCSGWLIQTYIIQCQYYLPWLMERFKQNGGSTIEKRIHSFKELPDCDVIINCSGFGARELCGDNSVYPAQGQVAHIDAPHVKSFLHCEEVYPKPPEERRLIYALPQYKHVVVGGTYIDKNSSLLTSEEAREAFMNDLKACIPSIKSCPILTELCGLRPCRDVLRLEPEKISLSSGKTVTVVHNYGHGGNGIALSWGTAEVAAEMAHSACVQCKL